MRSRLFRLVAATASLVLIAFLVPLALLVRQVAADRATTAATTAAQSLVPVVATADRGTVELTVSQVRATSRYPITVLWPADDGLIGAPAPRSPALRLAARGRSVTAEAPGGREILVAVQGAPAGTIVIRTFVTTAELRAGVLRAWLILGLLGIGLLGVGLVVADAIARSMLGPVTALAALSQRLSGGDLDARIDPAGPPEIRDVGAALNHLAGRIGDLLTGEREAAADLSHRLRTPLTALRLETESLRDPAEAERVTAVVDALERTVTQIISDTRHPRRSGGRCDARQILTDRVAYWSALADEQDRPVGTVLPDHPVPVAVDGDELAAAVDALLENVFAHTPEATAFTVRLEATTSGARIVIGDDGPGLPVAGLPGRGRSGRASTGLGLDIARRTAHAASGALTLGRSPSGGAEVTMTLPAPTERS
ncbi:HAMP domain-containing sensor histidine kinase [Actinoallomurus soli]|uniref:HAMP domain-containing sensor histidine kinase n=1 Tax=Actinoallomurus soli TaxID=2952535 RepID=UPI00209204DA|nr:HAMP domain-containing sensor histidine kinase [Actinoallomurus soli]MCO5972651.1 HAMP domain-containing histidine kinase [Actinoallomurus soli]